MIPVQKAPGRPVLLAGVAVSALLLGAGGAVAATNPSGAPAKPAPGGSASPTPAPVAPHAHWPGFKPSANQRWPRFQRPPGGIGSGLAGAVPGPFGALHGQFVVPKSGGGYQTLDMQRGKVTAVSTSSITVKSDDGYTKTYQVVSSTNVDAQRDGISSVKTGNEVTVFATVSSGSATAASIFDSSVLPKGGFWPGMRFKSPAAPG